MAYYDLQGNTLHTVYDIHGNRIYAPDNITINDVVSYYRTPTQEMTEKLNTLSDDYASFAVITDVHLDGNMRNSQNIARYLLKNSRAKKLFLLGDYTGGADFEAYATPLLNCAPQVFPTLGNHEWYGSAQFSEVYNMFLADKTLNGSTQNYYYYIDDAQRKIRYIVINFCETAQDTMREAQFTWLSNAVQLPSADWTIVAMGHYDIDTTWPYGTTATHCSRYSERIRTILLSTNGIFGGWFCGHQHFDRFTNINGEFPHTVLLNDVAWKETSTSITDIPTRKGGTTSEQAVSIISINPKTRHVLIDRIGAYIGSFGVAEYDY